MKRHRAIRATLLTWALFLASAPAFAQGRNCSALLQSVRVRSILEDIYFWQREIPDVALTNFDGPEQYLDAVRYRPLDATFSYITTEQANTAFYDASQFVGFGFSTQITATGQLRVTQVFPASPASEAGLQRGDRLTSISGRAVAELIAANETTAALGPAEIGVSRNIVFMRADGNTSSAQMTKRLVTIPTVSLTRVLNVDGRRVGYVFFRNFVQPSFAALDAAFAELQAAGVSELVLDLRYNGGGLVSVAQHLASLIGGSLTNGQVFTEFFHNDRNTDRNEVLRFERKANALTVNRIFVITTRASASASELVINSLRPFMPVIQIGDRTFGKPVGQYSFTFCQKVLVPVSFTLRNANREGDFFNGLQATCAAADDVERPLGDELEGSLREALTYIRTGACTTTVGIGVRSLRSGIDSLSQSSLPDATGWEQLLGAH